MGQRGPLRKPGSRRWKAEVRSKQRLNAAGSGSSIGSIDTAVPEIAGALPLPPSGLSRDLEQRWLNLVADMVAAGIQVRQVDVRAIAVAARYEQTLANIDEICERDDIEAEIMLSAHRTRLSAMKEYLSALEKIGGTPLVRMRARIAPEEKPKKEDDPWSGL